MRLAALAALLCASACGTVERDLPSPVPREQRVPDSTAAFFDCLRERALTIVAANRGGDTPTEHSLPAMLRTIRGAPGPVVLNVDARQTRDGRFVLIHDERLERTTTGNGPVAAASLREIQRLKLKNSGGEVLDERPPTLDDALDLADDRALVAIDLKAGYLEELIQELRQQGATDRTLLWAPTPEIAQTIQSLAPSIMLIVPAGAWEEVDRYLQAGVNPARLIVYTGSGDPDPALNVALAEQGIEAAIGTIGTETESEDSRFATAGDRGYTAIADTGIHLILSNRSLEAMRALNDADGRGVAAKACLTDDP